MQQETGVTQHGMCAPALTLFGMAIAHALGRFLFIWATSGEAATPLPIWHAPDGILSNQVGILGNNEKTGHILASSFAVWLKFNFRTSQQCDMEHIIQWLAVSVIRLHSRVDMGRLCAP